MSVKITSPFKGYTRSTMIGRTPLMFTDSVATVDRLSDSMRRYLLAAGYTIDDEPDTPAETVEETGEFNPADHTVAEVNEYLAHADVTEQERVLAAEKAGKDRSTVTIPEPGEE